MEIVDYLAGTIGERLSGTKNAERAATYLAGRFADLGLDVAVQEFPFVGWKPGEKPSLRLLQPVQEEVAVAPSNHTIATPPQGITGLLVPAGISFVVPGLLEWPRFALIDRSGKEVAHLVGHRGLGRHEGRAIVVSNPDYMFPSLKAITSSTSSGLTVAGRSPAP